MKATLKSIGITCWLFAAALQLHAQGYIVPNGVTYGGFNSLGSLFNVVHDPGVNNGATGFFLKPTSMNTFSFGGYTDVGVRVFLVSQNDPISLQPILSMNYTELGGQPSYTFGVGTSFYVSLYTGNSLPQNGIYNDPSFGWAELMNNNGVIQLLGGAVEYQGGGIYAGTTTIIPTPEPGTLALFTLGAVGIFASHRKWRQNK